MQRLLAALAAVALGPRPASALELLRRNATNASASAGLQQLPTFAGYYQTHTGPGMWKWDSYLAVYQRHFGHFAGKAVKMLEIGVQSGGSINMYHAVLGAQCYYYGMDVNTNCVKFDSASAKIYIGDQASVPAWAHFFTAVAPGVSLDIVIDDGGHQAHQMLTTFQQVLPHLAPGGSLATEDIHGQNDDYLSKFLHPAAEYLGWHQAGGGSIASVHLYPFMLLTQRSGGQEGAIYAAIPPAALWVSTLPDLMTALPANLGKTVALSNPSWPSFLGVDGLKNLFGAFYGLFEGAVTQQPADCHNLDNTANCKMLVVNSNIQNLVTGVHIYPTMVLVEVAAAPPSLFAIRKGSQWIAYHGP